MSPICIKENTYHEKKRVGKWYFCDSSVLPGDCWHTTGTTIRKVENNDKIVMSEPITPYHAFYLRCR